MVNLDFYLVPHWVWVLAAGVSLDFNLVPHWAWVFTAGANLDFNLVPSWVWVLTAGANLDFLFGSSLGLGLCSWGPSGFFVWFLTGPGFVQLGSIWIFYLVPHWVWVCTAGVHLDFLFGSSLGLGFYSWSQSGFQFLTDLVGFRFGSSVWLAYIFQLGFPFGFLFGDEGY